MLHSPIEMLSMLALIKICRLLKNIISGLHSLPDDKILNLSKLKAFPDDIMNLNKKTESEFWKGRGPSEKTRKCCFPAFSPFLTMFSNSAFSVFGKSRDWVVTS